MRKILFLATSISALALAGCQQSVKAETEYSTADSTSVAKPVSNQKATVQDAREFLQQAEHDLSELGEYASRIYWINANFITDDTNWLASKVGAEIAKKSTSLANEAKRFDHLSLPEDMARKIDKIKRGSNFPAPEKAGAAEELSEIMTSLDTTYGTGKFKYKSDNPEFASLYEDNPDGVLSLGALTDIMAKSRDPKELKTVWEGWRQVSVPMKADYVRMVDIINEGSRELGFSDAGQLWRAGYDMDADAFAKEADRLWAQVKPLYDDLHCHVRSKLNEQYGDSAVPLDQPIRADLLGNMWAQQWNNIYDIVAPEEGGESVDITALLEKHGYDQIDMVKAGEAFFTSLGLDPLPQTFWERSLITKPRDREVQCHASAWDIDDKDDIRIKMCTKITGEDFSVVHHELGHNFYQRAYKDQSVFYRSGANDGFHEAIGDMIALSITPDYLVEIGLLDPKDIPGEDADTALLMQQALGKVAFLPFGLMVDQWRWKVFSGEYSPSEYNSGWWELREKYQGVRAPSDRPANAFDPGAKYHIPGNTPYMRYFLAHILQFQFHKAACEMSGYQGPLHRCSIYDNKAVGQKFNAMMEMGASKPWPDALEAFTGTREIDGSAILEYFAPLHSYLKEQNKDRTCGW